MSVTDGSDRLMLGDCAACGYALQGLPRAGTCPECGSAYDEQVVVLHGWARGPRATLANSTPRKVGWLIASQSLLPLALGAAGAPLVMIAVIACVSLLVTGGILWKRSSNPLPAPVQVQLSAAGCVQLDNPGSRYNERVTPWRLIEIVRLHQVTPDRCRLTLGCAGIKWGPQPTPAVHALVVCTPEQSDALRTLLQRWLDEADDDKPPITLH